MNSQFYEKSFFSSGRQQAYACLMIAIPAFVSSCNIINPAEPVPAYVHVDSFSVTTDQVTQGSNSHKIVDAWVFVDGSIIGAFEMPVNIPILSAGMHKVTVRPGILLNGIAATRSIYPFYSGFDTIMNLESAKINTTIAGTDYKANTKFKIEDFDHTGSNFKKASISDTDFVIVQNSQTFEGNAGAVYLDNTHSYFECAWKDSFLLPYSGPAFVELNYQSDNAFTVGLVSYLGNSAYLDDLVTFKASPTWKKEYVTLGPTLANYVNGYGFKIYIRATKNADQSSALLYFDNIKVVY